jgi:4a-hydroxytetrahydrobiopterin dehydratase
MKSDLVDALKALGWEIDEAHASASRFFQFKDFVTAFEFMTEVGNEAERLGHHPDWRNVYRDVWVTLTTHDVGGLTQLDVALAQCCNTIFADRGSV